MRRSLRGSAVTGRLATAVAVLCLAGACAAQAAPAWRALYRGTVGTDPAVLDLELQGTTASARLLLTAKSRTFDLTGTSDASGAARLHAKTTAAEAATLRVQRSMAPNDDGRTLTGTLALAGASLPLAMRRVARYVRWDVREGPIQVEVSYPDFGQGALGSLDPELAPRARAEIATFLAQGRRADAAGTLYHAWQLLSDTRLEGLAGDYVSLLTTRYAFTGGAHGEYTYLARSWQLGAPAPRRLTLSGLFRPGSDFMGRLGPLVLADLRRQGADWVVQGQVRQLTERDLALFSLTPAGLAFTFPPYAMGPYVQGAFTAVVPYADVVDLGVDGGALRAFAAQAH